jgi:lysophospholipase L1-like esterase
MRDREYSLDKPAGTCRIALFGDSYTMGFGVADTEDYPTLLEDRLNRKRPLTECNRYEILNFAIGGYSAIQSALLAKVQVPKFNPDVVMYVPSHNEFGWVRQRLAYAIEEGATFDEEPFLQGIRDDTGLSADLSYHELVHRLKPVTSELIKWAYASITAAASSIGARPVWVFLPQLRRDPESERKRYATTSELARAAGFVTLSLERVWDGDKAEALSLRRPDPHPNAAGHARIADHFFDELATNWTILAPAK